MIEFNNMINFIMGMSAGILLMILMLSVEESNNSKYISAKAECEKTLPRNQHCKVIGVPDNIEGEQ